MKKGKRKARVSKFYENSQSKFEESDTPRSLKAG
jgi:hypothetical protein